ncbi:MAG: gliding motility-associated C-terminal domain-containing protein [Bacteroidia bacterium]
MRHSLFLSLLVWCFMLAQSQAQTVCNAAGNVMIYSNYEGGTLNIDVDVNIPNLKIGICTYEAVQVNIGGAFVGNVTQVIYAGFGGLNNNNCGPNIPAVAISGVPANIVTTYSTTGGNTAIANYLGDTMQFMSFPLVNCIVGAEGCGQTASGGGNSSPQIVQFFLAEFGAGSTLYAHFTDYSCFPSNQVISNGGNCCLETPSTAPNPIYQSGATYNFILPNDTMLCSDSITIDLSAYQVLYQPPTYSGYVWSDGTIGPIITITQPGTYSFYVSDYCHGSWSYYLTDTIVVLPCCAISNINTQSIDEVCPDQNNGSATASATGSQLTYSWNTNPPQIGQTATNLGPGIYVVTITDSSGCSINSTVTITTTNTPPTINAGADTTILFGNTTTLNAFGATNYYWTPATGLSCTNCPSPIASPSVTTTYIVQGVDANGCFGLDTITVTVDLACGDVFVPTGFSPNGDNANDILYVYGNCITEMNFRVFDRWGELVFQSSDPTKGWNGEYKGEAVNTGVFAYTLEATLLTGKTEISKGNIHLIR